MRSEFEIFRHPNPSSFVLFVHIQSIQIDRMGKAEAGSTKAAANAVKAKGELKGSELL